MKGRRVSRPVMWLCVLVAALSGTVVRAAAGVPTSEGYEIHINIPEFRLRVYRYGVPFRQYPIAVGGALSPSNLGRTEIVSRVIYPVYYPPNWYREGLTPLPPGPENPVGTRWLGLGFAGYGIHGTNAPHTIGSAVSAGCIRMTNRDVEELAEWVGVGTPVYFTYETVLAWRDPATGSAMLRVVQDVYRQGTNTLSRARARLDAIGVGDVDPVALQALLRAEDGNTYPVPIPQSVRLAGEPLQGAFDWGGETFVSLDAIARRLNETVEVVPRDGGLEVWGRYIPGAIALGGQAFGPIEPVASALGLSLGRDDGTWTLDPVRIDWGSDPLEARALVDRAWLLLPVAAVAERVGVSYEIDVDRQAVRVDGKLQFGARFVADTAYLSADRLAGLTGARVIWSPDEATARIDVPQVEVRGSADSVQSLWHDGALYVALDPLLGVRRVPLSPDLSTQTVWSRSGLVRGRLRAGELYVPADRLAVLFPQASVERTAEGGWRIEL